MRLWRSIFLILNIAITCSLSAQIPQGVGQTQPVSIPGLNQDTEKDTFDFSFFYVNNPEIEYPFTDTLLPKNFEFHDPVKRKPLERINLGHPGSASRPVFYESRFHRGFEIGLNVYEPYEKDPRDMFYYNLKKAYTSAYYVQGNTQNNNYFEGKFSRNFDKNLNLALDYARLNDDGDFQTENSKITALSVGFFYDDAKGKYDASFSFTSNVNDQENNGGIDSTRFTSQNLEREITVPVLLDGTHALTRYDHKNFTLNHSYNLAQPANEFRKPRVFKLTHYLNYKTGFYKFSDTTLDPDSSYYQDLQINNNGLRMFISDNSLENSFSISTSKSGDKAASGESTQKDLIELGLTNLIHWIGQEPQDTTLTNVLLTARINFNPNKNLKINTYGHYNIVGANFSDYYLKGELFLESGKLGKFKAQIINQLYSPYLTRHRYYISKSLVWENDFNKTFETSLSASYAIPQWDLKIEGQYHVISDFIYYDTSSMPVQHDQTISIPQLVVQKGFKFGNFHFDNLVGVQSTPEEVLRLPSFYSRHSLYYEGFVFRRAMLTRLGLDLRLHGNYFGDGFNPLVGQFHLQNDLENKLYPMLDIFLNYRVGSVRGFIKMENLVYYFDPKIYFQTANYATPYTVFRFGINWRFLG